MSYKKPGVEVTQITRLNTPNLVTPEIATAVVGVGYDWIEPSVGNEEALLETQFTGTQLVISGIATNWVPGTEVIDLIQVNNGAIIHLDGGDYSINTGTGDLTIDTDKATTTCSIIAGRLQLLDSVKYQKVVEVVNQEDLRLAAGEPVSFNPLAMGTFILMQNSNAATSVVAVDDDTAVEHQTARELLETKEVYAIAALTRDATAADAYKAHVQVQSLPENKKERIVFVNKPAVYSGSTSSAKLADAEDIRDGNSSIKEKRFFSIHPDICYIRENRHVNTLTEVFAQAVFGNTFDAKHLFAQRVTIGGVLYKPGDEITDTLVTALVAAGISRLDVFSAAPGYYYAAQVAGQVAGTSPSQPLTNVPGVGISRVAKSNDWFTENQLNVIASGGTWIMVQDAPNSPVYTRHQLSTDNTQVTTQEMSITKSVDYTAKFMRNSLKPYIGRMVINDAFLELVFTVLVGTAFYLKRSGIVRDVKIGTIEQDSINPDTINVEVNILPLYPANYIKIKLVI